MTSKLLTIRDVANDLNITEKEVIDLAERGLIPAYKVGGVYLRFKKEQVDQVRHKIKPNQSLVKLNSSSAEKMRDFIYRNDFYVLSLVLVFILLYFILKL